MREPTLCTDLVIFGGGGDLSLRMLMPSLFWLECDGLLPPGLRVWAVSRSAESRDGFLGRVRQAIGESACADAEGAFERLSQRLAYVAADASSAEGLASLAEAMGPEARPIFFLAVSPTLYAPIAHALAGAGLAGPHSRIVLEKPVGRDRASFLEIDAAVSAAFPEERVLRVDHYLGKETVQNLIALRFANVLFEPLWNNLSIDHVQITVAETGGVGDRWPYYDEYGALRDMVQNHMLQLLCLVAMEPPSDLDPDSVRNEKVKVLRSLRPMTPGQAPLDTVRGQYVAGLSGGEAVPAYADERGQASDTETFAAMKVHIDNWRWAGTPFFLRTGKRLAERSTEIVIQFKALPHSIFDDAGRGDIRANRLVISLQPDEDISLLLMNKAPGLDRRMRLQALPLSLSWGMDAARTRPPRRRIAYERLLLDAMAGDSTLFVRRDEAEKAWEWVDGVAEAWAAAGGAPRPYPAGTWGPPEAFALMERNGRAWHE